ncbi:hypothetical protein V1294_004369 [Bradyrhizobium sp. AZCC 1678]|uniref:hypothetical protein n=1 Tax=Bradyrhizobium sp. AZCC 1678 TaxID=3117030 RepID=UPI002FF3F846
MTTDPRVDFILQNAGRLITVATRCAWSFGAADGLNDVLTAPTAPTGEWRQPVSVLHRDSLLMAALRVAILLDADATVVSFQTLYHGLKEPAVQAALLKALEARRGLDVFTPTRVEIIAEYLRTYREIDWNAHGRLTHFRNMGIAHLTVAELKKSVTIAELRTMVGIISRLAVALQHFVQTDTAFRDDMADECRDQVKRVITSPRSLPI